MKLAIFFLLVPFALIGQTVHNRTTGVDYATVSAALSALTDGGSNVLIEIDANQTITATATFSKNFSNLTIRGVGQPTVDCAGLDSWINFNGTSKSLQNIVVDNFRITNNNTATGSAAALRFTTVGGTNYLQRITFTNCSVPVRATTNCGGFIVEDCVARNYTFSVFRFGLGPTTGVNPNTADMGPMVFRRCDFYADNNASTEADLTIKRMASLLVEDCRFYNPSKYAVDVYDPAFASGQGIIRRCLFSGGHAKATSGGTVNIAPNTTTGTGSTQSFRVESNVFDGDKGSAFSQTNGGGTAILNNTFIEGSASTQAMVLFNNCKNFTQHYNNLYVCNSGNTNPVVNIGTMTYDSDQLRSDYNLYYKTNARSLIQGTTSGGSNAQTATSATLAALQAKGYDARGLNTLPAFNTTQKKFSAYYLTPTSAGSNVANTAYLQSRSHVFGVTGYPTQDIGRLTNRVRRYRLGRTRIVKQN